MNKHTKKKINKLQEVYGQEQFTEMLASVVTQGKAAFDAYTNELGRMLAEAIMYIDRENISGPDYHPKSSDLKKWASQPGSVYIGDKKVKVNRPRLRSKTKEVELESYKMLKRKDTFSEELLLKTLAGLSGRQYENVIQNASESCGVSPSSVSRHIVKATVGKLKEFSERSLADIDLVAILLDTVHRGGSAFLVAIGVDIAGNKHALGFWEGASENNVICKELLSNLEQRGLVLKNSILFVTDGGKGIIKALKDKFGKKLAHQRCTIHKDRNIQKHLPKKYRKSAHNRFRDALKLTSYDDAKEELLKFEKWLRTINESSADSLKEAFEELLFLHKINAHALLRRSLHTTNIIESTFARVRDCEKNVKRYRGSAMAQRWLASALLHCEKTFHRLEGHSELPDFRESIIRLQEGLD